MFSSSFPLSTPFPTTAVPPPSSARFHRSQRISATHATATRPLRGISTSASLYEVLGVPMGATFHEIKAAYRKLARIVHPDVRSDGQEEFMKVHAAYATLADPSKRDEYDRTLFKRQRSVVPPYSSRRWETDQCW